MMNLPCWSGLDEGADDAGGAGDDDAAQQDPAELADGFAAFAAAELDDHADADDDHAQDAEDQADSGGPVQDGQQAFWPGEGRRGSGSG